MIPADVFVARSRMFTAIRAYLNSNGFIEVETPILSPYPDIAPVRQFVTTHPTTKVAGILRIAPTEYLKRLLLLGMDSVYEFSTNFRDEDYTPLHLSEFTSLEVMKKGSDVFDMTSIIERICKSCIITLCGQVSSLQSNVWGDKHLTIDTPWPNLSLPEYLREVYEFEPEHFFDDEKVSNLYNRLGSNNNWTNKSTAIEEIITNISKAFDTPVFIGEFPIYVGGPAKLSTKDSRFKERTELYFRGIEMANMSSTLTSYAQLKIWHEETILVKSKNNIYPNRLDEPLLLDIRNGLEESAVVGLGLDRLLMICLNLNDIALTRPFSYNNIFKSIQHEVIN